MAVPHQQVRGSMGYRHFSSKLGLYRGIFYWGYIGIMEKKMETTLLYWGIYRVIQGPDLKVRSPDTFW